MLEVPVVGLQELVVPGGRAPDAAEKLPLVAEEPLLAVDVEENESARNEAQDMREEGAPAHRVRVTAIDR